MRRSAQRVRIPTSINGREGVAGSEAVGGLGRLFRLRNSSSSPTFAAQKTHVGRVPRSKGILASRGSTPDERAGHPNAASSSGEGWTEASGVDQVKTHGRSPVCGSQDPLVVRPPARSTFLRRCTRTLSLLRCSPQTSASSSIRLLSSCPRSTPRTDVESRSVPSPCPHHHAMLAQTAPRTPHPTHPRRVSTTSSSSPHPHHSRRRRADTCSNRDRRIHRRGLHAPELFRTALAKRSHSFVPRNEDGLPPRRRPRCAVA